MKGNNYLPLVSIITPLYNAENFIANAITSVQSQSYENWEMIIVDDCSMDKGPGIVKELAVTDNRILFFQNNNNIGPAKTRNFAIERAKGRYIAFLDADDKWLPQKLELQIMFMFERGIVFSYTDYSVVTESGHVVKSSTKPPAKVDYNTMLLTCFIGCLTAIYDTKQIGKVYMPDLEKRQDYGLWLRILRTTKHAFLAGENPLAIYTQRKSSVSSNKLTLVKYNWKLFYKIERLSLLKSLYYLMSNIFYKILR